MTYHQFDKDGKEVKHQDLQAKSRWCKDGERIEHAFVQKYGQQLRLKINPGKTDNPYAPDLIFEDGQLADLKTQNTPFFKSGKLYGIDASYAVVFNRKDAVRYHQLYPHIIIYFWIEWHSVRFEMGNYSKSVEYLNGVFKIPFPDLTKLLKAAPLHEYQQRKEDLQGNAKSSFVLDIRDPLFKKVA